MRSGHAARILRGAFPVILGIVAFRADAQSRAPQAPLELTADFGYFRLRDEGYGPKDIEDWGLKIAALQSRCKDIFVYFKHEEEGKGAVFARDLMTQLGLPVTT